MWAMTSIEMRGNFQMFPGNSIPPPSRSKTGGLEKSPCKSAEQDENHETSPKKLHAGRGQETKWEIPVKTFCILKP
jgi:hypothetical protein